MTDHSIKGKTVIIAGGAKNLGGLIARDLAAQGAKAVAIHYNSEAARAEADATVAAIKAAGAEAVALQANLTTADAMQGLFDATIRALGRPDCPSSKHLAQVWRGVNGERASSGVGF